MSCSHDWTERCCGHEAELVQRPLRLSARVPQAVQTADGAAAAALFVTIAAFAAVIALAATGHLQALADRIAELGWSGHLIFCALLIYTGLVFGYGWTFFAVATGCTFGWWALITIIGTALGAALGFLVRYWLQSLVEQKVASLPAHWSARVLVMQHEVSSSTLGFFLCLACCDGRA